MKQWGTSMKFCILVQESNHNFIPKDRVESYVNHWMFVILESQTIEIECFLEIKDPVALP